MLDGTGNVVAGTDMVYEQVPHGTNGYQVGLNCSIDGTQLLAWGDVTSVMKKAVTATTWDPCIVPGKIPSGIIQDPNTAFSYPNTLDGSLHAAFAGNSNTKMFVIQTDRVLYSSDGVNFSNTAIVGMPVGSNSGYARIYSDKGASDPVNQNVYYACMGQYGLKYTLDSGATYTSAAWCPVPTYPYPGTGDPNQKLERWGIIAIDNGGGDTSSGVIRKKRIAVSFSGIGVYLSTDGCATGTKISTASGDGFIEAVSGMAWIGGKLYVCAVPKDTVSPDGTENLRVYDPTGGTWTKITTGFPSYGHLFPVEDPRYPGVGYWLFNNSGEACWTSNGTTFLSQTGYFNGTAPHNAALVVQTKPRKRPMIASKPRIHGFGAAPAKPKIVGSYLYYPNGLGVLRTITANFPQVTGDFNDFAYNAHWPIWEEDCAGIEEIVGISCEWIKDPLHNDEYQLIGLGGDIAIAMHEDGRRGHKATVTHHPNNYLSNGIGASAGSVSGWATCRLTRRVSSNEAATCYTKDAYNWTKMANQPQQGGAAHDESGRGVTGPLDEALSFPGSYGARPQGTRDCGATPWVNLRFFREDNSELDLGNAAFSSGLSMNGFWGYILYARPHYLAWHDNDNPGTYYAVNIGASYDNTVTDFTSDPLDFGGVYKMSPGDWPNFRRIYAGNPTKYSNYAYYDCHLEGDGAGHVLFCANYLPSDAGNGASNNKIVIIDTTTGARTQINSVRNVAGFSFGAPLNPGGPKTLWMLGYNTSGVYGLYYSTDLGATAKGPFSTITPTPGYISYIAAHPTKFGTVAMAVQSRGHVIGRLQLGGT